MRIDEVIDRLQRVWANAGQDPLPGPKSSLQQVLADIASVITPRRLPDEIVTFWRRLSPEYLEPLSPFPHLTSPEFALRCWLEHEKQQRTTPASLFPIADQSHCFTFVELTDDEDPGGALFDWADGDFQLTHPSLSSYLDQLATMLELGEYIAQEEPDGQISYEFDPLDQWSQIAAVRLAPSLPLPRYGTKVTIGEDIREWPQHWLLASGLTEASRRPRGADSTIAALLESAASGGESRGTVQAEVVRSAGTAAGRRLTIHDGTGRLDVWCPSAVTANLDRARVLEFEVVLRPRLSGPPGIERLRHDAVPSMTTGDLSGAQQAGADLYAALFDSPADALATAIRPVG